MEKVLHYTPLFLSLIVITTGISFAIARKQRHPKISLLVIISLSINLITRLFNELFLQGLINKFPTPHDKTEFISLYMFIYGLIGLISLSLLLLAIFIGRNSSEHNKSATESLQDNP